MDLSPELEHLRQRIAPLKKELLDHPLYREIDSLESLHVFMEHHVFAVWDFMSLLKTLQRHLTCVDVPWLPTANPIGCRFINEIVVGEESDIDGQGGFLSHFEFYRRAMVQCGANTVPIEAFVHALRHGESITAALDSAHVQDSARAFVRQTFDTIEQGDLCAAASAFTFAREDLLPAVFQRVVDELNVAASGGLDLFRDYLNRHIHLDGEEHGPIANRLMQSLCGTDAGRWKIAEEAAVSALAARRVLWDGIHVRICGRKSVEPRAAKSCE
jgi:hypothetical protein